MGKSKNNITNWAEDNRALTQRGSITFWVDESAIEAQVYNFADKADLSSK